MKILRCEDFPDAGCCDSCHEDEGLGYELLDYTLADGTDCIVCCDVAWYLEKEGKL